ncbi:MAG: hypothetical protein AAB091_01440 [Elusimicrobiota bacterium]|mgnify:CR=1 FL=1
MSREIKYDSVGGDSSTDPIVKFLDGSTERARITQDGKLGVGAASPGDTLDVQAATGTARITSTTSTNRVYLGITNAGTLTIGKAGSTANSLLDYEGIAYAGVIEASGSNSLQLATNATARLTIDSSGKVGIGTNAPGAKLEVNGQISANAGSVSSPAYGFVNDLNTGMYSPGADSLSITTGGTERLRINSDGNVGIGTSTFDGVSDKLVISRNGMSTGDIVETILGDRSVSSFALQIRYEHNSTEGSRRALFFMRGDDTASGVGIILKKGGKVGIGANSPTSLLHLRASSAKLTIEDTAASPLDTIQFGPDGSTEASFKCDRSSAHTFTIGHEASGLQIKFDGGGGPIKMGGASTEIVKITSIGTLILRNYDGSGGEPTGETGALYFRTDTNKIRVYYSGGWHDA